MYAIQTPLVPINSTDKMNVRKKTAKKSFSIIIICREKTLLCKWAASHSLNFVWVFSISFGILPLFFLLLRIPKSLWFIFIRVLSYLGEIASKSSMWLILPEKIWNQIKRIIQLNTLDKQNEFIYCQYLERANANRNVYIVYDASIFYFLPFLTV